MASLDDLLAVVHVVNEAVERGHALHQTGFHALPLVGRNDAGNQVKRDQALCACSVFVFGTVHRKRDAHAAEDHLGLGTPGLHHVFGLLGQPFGVLRVVSPDCFRAGIHFVEHLNWHEMASSFSLSKSIAISGPANRFTGPPVVEKSGRRVPVALAGLPLAGQFAGLKAVPGGCAAVGRGHKPQPSAW
jgi:hypothetical protein